MRVTFYDLFVHAPFDVRKTIIRRVGAFMDKTLHLNELPSLMQDCIDAGALPLLPRSFRTAAAHCSQEGLCSFPWRPLH